MLGSEMLGNFFSGFCLHILVGLEAETSVIGGFYQLFNGNTVPECSYRN